MTNQQILKGLLGVLLLSCHAGCMDRSPIPFDCTFDGPASGGGMLVVDRLSQDRMQGIVASIRLIDGTRTVVDTTLLETLRDEGRLELTLPVTSTNPLVDVKVYYFSTPVDEFYWYHHNFEKFVIGEWKALSGALLIELFRHKPTPALPTARVVLSNAMFSTDRRSTPHTIDTLDFGEVPVGYWRE